MDETILKRLQALEKKVEKYYRILFVENELDFIMKGTYFAEDLEDVLAGKYELED